MNRRNVRIVSTGSVLALALASIPVSAASAEDAACPVQKLEALNVESFPFDFLIPIGEKRLDDAHKLLSAATKAKMKPADLPRFFDPHLPNVKGGVASLSNLDSSVLEMVINCEGAVPVAHVVRTLLTDGNSQGPFVFEIVEEGGAAKIRDVYPKNRSDIQDLSKVPTLTQPDVEALALTTLKELTGDLSNGNLFSFGRSLSLEKRLQLQPDIMEGDKLTKMFVSAMGKVKPGIIDQFSLTPVLSAPPAPARMEKGYPTLDTSGTIDTQPERIKFALKYVYDMGRWAVHDFKFDFEPLAADKVAAAVAPAVEPAAAKPVSTGPVRLADPKIPYVVTYKLPDRAGMVVAKASGGVVRHTLTGEISLDEIFDLNAKTFGFHGAGAGEPLKRALDVNNVMGASFRYALATPVEQHSIAGETCTKYKLAADVDALIKDGFLRKGTSDEGSAQVLKDAIAAGLGVGGVTSARVITKEEDDEMRSASWAEACVTADGITLAWGYNGRYERVATRVERRPVEASELSFGK